MPTAILTRVMIAPLPAAQSYHRLSSSKVTMKIASDMNQLRADSMTIAKQSTSKPRAYIMGYTFLVTAIASVCAIIVESSELEH